MGKIKYSSIGEGLRSHYGVDGLNAFGARVYENAVDHGFYEDQDGRPETFLECVSLMHAELSEAVEQYRRIDPQYQNLYTRDAGGAELLPIEGMELGRKPEGIAVELADCVLLILGAAAYYKIDLEAVLIAKHIYNTTRDYRHGGMNA